MPAVCEERQNALCILTICWRARRGENLEVHAVET